MKSVTLTAGRLVLLFVFQFCFQPSFNRASAQAPSLNAHLLPLIDLDINGFYDYLPRNYEKDVNQHYPLLIFFHGLGDSGSLLDLSILKNVLNAGTPQLLRSGDFPDSLYVQGKWFKFIVLAPQMKLGLFSNSQTSLVKPSTVDALIDYAIKTYRVDPSRIYLSGLSMGGGVATDYVASSPAAAKRIAAIAVAAAASNVSESGADNMAQANLPLMATHNVVDDVIPYGRTVSMLVKLNNSIRKANRNTGIQYVEPKSLYWSSAGEGDDKHNAWTRTFVDLKPGSSKGGNLADTLGASVYEWMLQYSRGTEGALPLVWESFDLLEKNKIVYVKWATSKEVRTKHFAVEKSTDGVNWLQIGTVPSSGDNESLRRYEFADNQYTGSSTFYRIKQVDLDEKFTYSVIKSIGTTGLAGSKAYPNPFSDKFSITIPSVAASGTVSIKLFNVKGELVRVEQLKVEEGRNYSYTLQGLQSLGKGNYILVVETDKKKVLLREKLVRK